MEAVTLSPAEQVRQWQDNYRRLTLSPARPNVVPAERVAPKRDFLWLETPPRPVVANPDVPASIVRIKADIAREHGFTVEEIDGEGRSARLVRARRACIVAVAAARPGWGTPRIGRAFKRDHTTILHHLRAAGVRP